ncbi:MAG: aminoacyl-tRNA hydrolase [Candidatus Kapabacteria bacterium]|nr:aminoacyl-tRNA hydrolase [Candidatus Kapabacteria bacterium]
MTSFLIVGLGNPGTQYSLTRHNIGFMVVDAFTEKHRAKWTVREGKYATSSVRIMATELVIVKPLTYMNLSGEAVAPLAIANGIQPSRVVAITDEYNFPVGRVHLRCGGSSGGHNGISSLIEKLGTSDFWRLRCGIDRAFGPGELVEYVLAPFSAEEQEFVKTMIDRGVQAIEEIARSGPEQAMQRINRA